METDLETLPVGEDAPRLLIAVIEVPVGSRNKYEYEPDLGVIMRARELPGAVSYPTDYGFVPSTLTGRGDALDIVVAADNPAFPGCVVRVRPIRALHMIDSKGEEHNMLAVPDDDPRFADIGALEDLPDENLREIEQFFEVYKRLESDKEAHTRGWQGFDDTQELIRECMQAFARSCVLLALPLDPIPPKAWRNRPKSALLGVGEVGLVCSDDFDSYRPYSVCALHTGGIESSGQILRTRGE